ncbi:AzlC family ABC transporter permease [Bartonella sp. HY329]|uniref:AzlC family ABC transporter permease n=1 Tax=unclassified Bartonella TaxID=2645622 RepID=UPI0021C771EB|nr:MULTISPECIES: AzlC family ABC transporter permease [unclassified Bartonella]UXM94363.1 AzlC family ABC transporter permease [Bartonella sp. HY329]UXN08686.1 AzlC family ABC transporter permease [Bartonella sp. HY328]
MQKENEIKRMAQVYAGVLACIPTLLGYWAIGFACGAVGNVTGFSTFEIAMMSVFIYAGSAQFLFYQFAAAGAGVIAIALAVGFINLRYLLINTYMSQFFSKSSWWEKLVAGALITDETFGVASQYAIKNNNSLPFYWLLGLNVTAWLSWIFANLVGSFFASLLPLWLRDSFSFSLVGMFVGLLLLGWFASRTRILDLIVMAIAIAVIVLTHDIFSSDKILENLSTLIATMVAATIATILLMWRTKKTKVKNNDA